LSQQQLAPTAVVANAVPTAETDGVPYCTLVPLAPTEAHLGDALKSPDPVPVAEGQTMVAVVRLTINGLITGSNAYVVMQTDLGDGTWIDVAWIVWTGGQGTATFVVCGGGLGAMNNAFQQTRQPGQVPNPQSSDSNAVPLGGRVQFIGKATLVSGSSSISRHRDARRRPDSSDPEARRPAVLRMRGEVGGQRRRHRLQPVLGRGRHG
jgi:hypothetical protein